MSRKIINAYPRFKEFNVLVAAGDNVAAVRKGLDFLRFVGREYERKQVYDHSEWDGDDFYSREADVYGFGSTTFEEGIVVGT